MRYARLRRCIKMYEGYTDWDEFIICLLLMFILLGIWGI